MNFSKKFFLIVSLLLLGTAYLFAQGQGQIHGTVKDALTGEETYGANVTLKNTSLGAASDFDGKYVINAVPSGSYTLSVRYIGYRTQEIPVEVKEGSKLEINFLLTAEAIKGEEVVITAQARGQQQAINQQLSSNTITNVVSSEKIRQLPDENAATALSRLPGVSLMNGDQVVIRGLEAKLNQVLVNGIELPPTDMSPSSTNVTSTRATNLGFISSNLLDGIEVIKAITPDMDANTIGGVVNLKLREAPTGLHFDALAQGNYNSTDHISDNYKFWASISDRFLDDKLGVFIQGNTDRTDGGNSLANIGVGLEAQKPDIWGKGVYTTTGATFEFDQDITTNSGGSVILDYKLPNGKIVLQNTYAGNSTDQNNNITSIGSFTGASVSYGANRFLYGKDLWINALQLENSFGSVKVDASLSHSFSQEYTTFGHDLGPTASNTVFAAGSPAPFANFQQGQMNGFSLTDACNVFNNIDPANAQNAKGGGGQWISINYISFAQQLYNSSLNVTVPVTFSDELSATFKAGGRYTRTTRENNIDERRATDANDIYANPAADTYFPGVTLSTSNALSFPLVMGSSSAGKYFLGSFYNFTNGGYRYTIDESKYDAWLKLSSVDWAKSLESADSWQNDWNGAEQFTAGYLMGTFNVGPKLTVLGGARFESYNMNYHAQLTYVEHNVLGNAIST